MPEDQKTNVNNLSIVWQGSSWSVLAPHGEVIERFNHKPDAIAFASGITDYAHIHLIDSDIYSDFSNTKKSPNTIISSEKPIRKADYKVNNLHKHPIFLVCIALLIAAFIDSLLNTASYLTNIIGVLITTMSISIAFYIKFPSNGSPLQRNNRNIRKPKTIVAQFGDSVNFAGGVIKYVIFWFIVGMLFLISALIGANLDTLTNTRNSSTGWELQYYSP